MVAAVCVAEQRSNLRGDAAARLQEPPRIAEVVERAFAEEQGAEDLPDDDVRAWVAFFRAKVHGSRTRGG